MNPQNLSRPRDAFTRSHQIMAAFSQDLANFDGSTHLRPFFVTLENNIRAAGANVTPDDIDELGGYLKTAISYNAPLAYKAISAVQLRVTDEATMKRLLDLKHEAAQKIIERGANGMKTQTEVDSFFIASFEDARLDPRFINTMEHACNKGLRPSAQIHAFLLGIAKNDAACDPQQQALYDYLAGLSPDVLEPFEPEIQ